MPFRMRQAVQQKPVPTPGDKAAEKFKQRRVRVGAVAVTLFDLDHSGMVIVRTPEEETALRESLAVKGAYVKVQFTVRSSASKALDTIGLREQLLKAGAVAVVVAPIVIPDDRGHQETAKRAGLITPEVHIRKWFEAAKGSRKLLERGIKEALQSISEAGL